VTTNTGLQGTTAAQPATRFQIFIWTLFDLANTSFSVLILTVAYPIYFTTIVAAGRSDADFLWGIGFSISMLVTAMISPVLGAIADHSAGKKRFLLYFTLLCILATAGLYFVGEHDLALGMLLLVLANIGFEAGLVFYDAFLPEITTERSYGRVSGYGFAMGYIGSLLTLILAFPLLKGEFTPENLQNVRLSFVLAASFFFIFALPLFFVLRDTKKKVHRTQSYIAIGIGRVKSTIRNMREYRNVGKFLISFFIYMDGVHTVIIFASIFAATTLGFTLVEILIFFITVQSTAIIGALAFGILSDSVGRKRTLSVTLLMWILVVILAFFTQDKTTFYLVGFIAGAAMGSSQSTSRSLMSTIIPMHKKTEFFGFYSFFGKSSAIVGPALFGILSTMFNQRIAVLSIGLFFVVGLILLQRVKEEPYLPVVTDIPPNQHADRIKS
jgi:MFS transporter, UMF1 family